MSSCFLLCCCRVCLYGVACPCRDVAVLLPSSVRPFWPLFRFLGQGSSQLPRMPRGTKSRPCRLVCSTSQRGRLWGFATLSAPAGFVPFVFLCLVAVLSWLFFLCGIVSCVSPLLGWPSPRMCATRSQGDFRFRFCPRLCAGTFWHHWWPSGQVWLSGTNSTRQVS